MSPQTNDEGAEGQKQRNSARRRRQRNSTSKVGTTNSPRLHIANCITSTFSHIEERYREVCIRAQHPPSDLKITEVLPQNLS